MAPQIHAPVKGFSGKVAGVQFDDGVGTTEDPGALAYFARHGYTVDTPAAGGRKAPGDGKGTPEKGWRAPELKAWAGANGVDLSGATNKDGVWAAIDAHLKAAAAADRGSGENAGDKGSDGTGDPAGDGSQA